MLEFVDIPLITLVPALEEVLFLSCTGVLSGNEEGILPGNEEGILPGNEEGILPGNEEGILPGNEEEIGRAHV